MDGFLQHLPKAPADFRQRCRAAESRDVLLRLSQHQLNGTQLEQLDRARRRICGIAENAPVRLGVLSNATTDFLPAAFGGTGLRYGLDIEAEVGDYGQILEEVMNPNSRVNVTACDAFLIALDHRGLMLEQVSGLSCNDQVRAAIDLVVRTREALRATQKTTVIFQTVAAPALPIFGEMDSVIGNNILATVQAFNIELRQLVRSSSGDLLLDVERLASTVGLQTWHSAPQWNIAKLPFKQEAMPLYAEHLVRLLAAQRGRSRKCLVLDLDNTCWGGAVGDLGLDGIVLGQGSALGEAFLDVQRTALALRDRGVILAVCSKNDHSTAIQPFREHPDMLLKEEHVSVFQANWINKATNLEEIARLLNIGLDSLVLLDDNPVERLHVRESLPMVGVPELTDDPSLYSSILLNAGYFESISFTAEDSQRANQYRANVMRSRLDTSRHDPLASLQALEMIITFAPFDSLNRSRIAQLINKTNQFNLTTCRYTEADVEAMETDPSIWTMQVRLVDRFGDNGMISCVICKSVGDGIWEIDTWLMSCRVLARRVEECSMMKVIEHGKARGIHTLRGRYNPSAKNDMVKSFYARLGFTQLDDNNGTTTWSLDLTTARIEQPPMIIEDRLRALPT